MTFVKIWMVLPMHAKLTQIRESIALAQEQAADLRRICPEEIRRIPEMDDIDAGLFQAMGQVETLRVRLDVYRVSHPDK